MLRPEKFRSLIIILGGLSTMLLLSGCGSPEDKAQGYYESGQKLLAKNDDVEAKKEFYRALKYKSDKIEAWRALASIYEREKVRTAQFQALQRIVELDPNDLDARLKLARIMIGTGAAEAGLKVIDTGKEGDKPSADLHALRAVALLRTNDRAGAMREAQVAYDIDPKNVDAVSLLASKKSVDGDPDGALKLLDSLTIDPDNETRISLQKLQIYAKKGDSAKAEGLLRKLIALNPSEQAYRAQLVQSLVAQRRFDEAENELRARSAANPTDTKAGLDLVRFLGIAKGADVAKSELDARIKAGGDVFDYQIALADLDVAQSKNDEAIRLLRSLADNAANPNDRKIAAELKLAELYVRQANIPAVEPLIADIIGKDRRNVGALKIRAAIKIDRDQIDSAVSDLREALNDQPKSAELLSLLAIAYERGGKNELADRQYADALKASNSSPDVALRYAAFLKRRGDATHAEDVLTDVSARYPNNLQLLSALAEIRVARKNWAGALAIADIVAKLNGGRAPADQIRAAALSGQNKVDESIAALQDAHQAAPDAVQPVVALVSAYVRQGKPDSAMALLQEINKKYPSNAEVLVLMGQTKLAQKKDDEAAQSFQGAIAQQPKDPVGYSALSDLYIRQKNYDAAGNVLQAGLKEMPANINFQLSSAGLQIAKGDHDAAIAQYEAILKDQPKALVAVNNLVSLLLDFRSDKASLDHAFQLADALKNSNVPQFQDTLGWAQFRQGDYKGAVSSLESAVAKAPNLAAAHYHLAMSYAASGEAEKSEEQLKLASALEPDGTALKESIRSAMK